MITTFSMVAAVDASRGIGKNGGLAWHLPADLKHFKEVTTTTTDPAKRNAVIMGRKTWESLPPKFRPLPGRLNGVLSRSGGALAAEAKNALWAADMDRMFSLLNCHRDIESVYVIGGAKVFQDFIQHPQCAGLRLTELQQSFDCDVFFPAIPQRFKISSKGGWLSEGEITYRFVDYTL